MWVSFGVAARSNQLDRNRNKGREAEIMQNLSLIVVAVIAIAVIPGFALGQSAPLESKVQEMQNYMRMNESSKALNAAERAVQMARGEMGHDRAYLANVISSLADLYVLHQFYAQAIPLYGEVISIRESEIGLDDPELGSAYNNIALVYKTLGHYEDAEPYVQRAIAVKEKNFGPDHGSLAPSLEIYATVLRETGRAELAEETAARAKTIRESQ
jgi:tetratricopeptide (TPR) repeat protein